MGYLDVKYAAGTAVGNRLTGGMHCTREEEEEEGWPTLKKGVGKTKEAQESFPISIGPI